MRRGAEGQVLQVESHERAERRYVELLCAKLLTFLAAFFIGAFFVSFFFPSNSVRPPLLVVTSRG